MYLGAEKAGIRLADYADVPFRVGEFMFDDESFNPVKGKTDELFSSLFHRRFVTAGVGLQRDDRVSRSSALAYEQDGETGGIDHQRRPQHHVHVRLPEGTLVAARPGHQTPRQVASRHRRTRAARSAQAFLGRGQPLCRRRQSLQSRSWPWEFPSRSRASRPAMVSPSSPTPTPRRPTVCNPTGTTLVGRPQSGLSSKVRAIPESLPETLRLEARIPAAVGEDALCRGRNAGRVRLVSHGVRRPAMESQPNSGKT